MTIEKCSIKIRQALQIFSLKINAVAVQNHGQQKKINKNLIKQSRSHFYAITLVSQGSIGKQYESKLLFQNY